MKEKKRENNKVKQNNENDNLSKRYAFDDECFVSRTYINTQIQPHSLHYIIEEKKMKK